MKLLGFLKRHLGAVVICFALICGQAYFQLMLPTAMSDIVDVGIRFTNWLRPLDLEKAKEFNNLLDAFIKDQMR